MMIGRIQKEIDSIIQNPQEGVALIEDYNEGKAIFLMSGPKGTPYEEGIFKIIAVFKEYPFKPPELTFETKIYHPIICKKTGLICPCITAKDWIPTYTIVYLLEWLRNLRINPNIRNGHDREINNQCWREKDEFDLVATEWTRKYAAQ